MVNLAHASLSAPGFLRVLFFGKCVCVCPWPPPNLANQTSHSANQFLYMTLAAIDKTDGCDLSNEARYKLWLKKSNVVLYTYLPFITQ